MTLSWNVVDDESVILNMTGCEVRTFTTDTPGFPVTCTAESDGGTNSGSVRVKVDRTPPAVAVVPERPPDANGWYNRPFSVSYVGTDVTSGIASCSPSSVYAGPDLTLASARGWCTDVAGNVTEAGIPFKYDATPPSITGLTARNGNRSLQLSWRASPDTSAVEIVRIPGRAGEGQSLVYRGTATGFLDRGLAVGKAYEYRLAGVDDAANRTEQVLKAVATGPLLSPAPAARVTGPPNLTWTAVKGATFYNLQLIRGRKVLSVWPTGSSYQLRRTWTHNGRRMQLRPGTYRWYVWPASRRSGRVKYGRLLGSSTFVVMK